MAEAHFIPKYLLKGIASCSICEQIMAAAAASDGLGVLLETARRLSAWDPCDETRNATESLVAAVEAGKDGAHTDLEMRFGSRLAFGTAGLRGPMGFGTSRMNEAVVIQSTQVRRPNQRWGFVVALVAMPCLHAGSPMLFCHHVLDLRPCFGTFDCLAGAVSTLGSDHRRIMGSCGFARCGDRI